MFKFKKEFCVVDDRPGRTVVRVVDDKEYTGEALFVLRVYEDDRYVYVPEKNLREFLRFFV